MAGSRKEGAGRAGHATGVRWGMLILALRLTRSRWKPKSAGRSSRHEGLEVDRGVARSRSTRGPAEQEEGSGGGNV